jgi:hypothetical protein
MQFVRLFAVNLRNFVARSGEDLPRRLGFRNEVWGD